MGGSRCSSESHASNKSHCWTYSRVNSICKTLIWYTFNAPHSFLTTDLHYICMLWKSIRCFLHDAFASVSSRLTIFRPSVSQHSNDNSRQTATSIRVNKTAAVKRFNAESRTAIKHGSNITKSVGSVSPLDCRLSAFGNFARLRLSHQILCTSR